MGKLMWWGYRHSNGSIQLKRWFGNHEDYTTDCTESPFVGKVVPPFEAPSRVEALLFLEKELK